MALAHAKHCMVRSCPPFRTDFNSSAYCCSCFHSLCHRCCVQVAHLRGAVERVVHDLLVGPHADTKLALLPHLHRLAAFCGRRDTADLLLPPLLTFLNSPQWQVRRASGMALQLRAGQRTAALWPAD